MSDTRTVHFSVDPALKAYMEYVEIEGRAFSLEDFDLFASGYRWRESQTPVAPAAEEMAKAGAAELPGLEALL